MSSGEVVGLLLTVMLIGVAASGAVAWLIWRRSTRLRESHVRRIDASAEWLAARVTLTRNSISFVTAFRELADEKGDADAIALRRDEAQRARGAWCDARRELDRAEAMLVAWSNDPGIRQRLGEFDQATPEALRAAVNADRQTLGRLIKRLRDSDDRAAELVRSAACGIRGKTLLGSALVTRLRVAGQSAYHQLMRR